MLRFAAVALVAVLVAAGCGGDSKSPNDATTRVPAPDGLDEVRPSGLQSNDAELVAAEVIRERRVIASALWGPSTGRDAASMAAGHEVAVVVRVRAREDLTWAPSLPGIGSRNDFPSIDAATGQPVDPDAQNEELPPGHPKAGMPRPVIDPETSPATLSRYDLEVLEVLGGSIGSDPLTVFQTGGVKNGIAYESAGNPVIEVGRTYVMFLSFDEKGWHWSTPWGRFEVGPDGSLIPVAADDWAFLEFRQQLEGKTVADLRSMVARLRFSAR